VWIDNGRGGGGGADNTWGDNRDSRTLNQKNSSTSKII